MSSEQEVDYPEWAICPLTHDVMRDPLMDKNGLTYEREAIAEWLLRGNATCPLTRKPLSYHMLIPNVALRLKIEQWKREHDIEVEPLSWSHKNVALMMMMKDDDPPMSHRPSPSRRGRMARFRVGSRRTERM